MKPVDQVETILADYKSLRERSQYFDLSDLSNDDLQHFITRARSAIHRLAPTSGYSAQCEKIAARSSSNCHQAVELSGVLRSLCDDMKAGFLVSLRELIHGELFGDFLEMADHLENEGFKDAAAVIAGSALEAHLRRLCVKMNIPIEQNTPKGLRPKKADLINGELASALAYSKLDQKNVVAWLDLRNKAAHGDYQSYQAAQVQILIAGTRDFVTRVPA